MWTHLRRIVVALVILTSLWILALFVDVAVLELFDVLGETTSDPDSAWWGPADQIPALAYFIIGLLIVGTLLWVVIGPVQQTRREQEIRRMR